MAVRLLFVDDEPGIRETFPLILSFHGFEVTPAASVAQALTEITTGQFDVLIADLNIGQPGDGFTVVSAMRRTQPDCVTFILTGYPALETALQAIRSQVDDYVIKPANIPELVAAIGAKLKNRTQQRLVPAKRVADILRGNVMQIAERTVHLMQAHPVLGKLPLSEEEVRDRLPKLVEGLAAQLQSEGSNRVPEKVMTAAQVRGEIRREQGFTVEMLVENIRLFERVIFDVIHEELFSVNLSYLMLDLKLLNESLGLQLQQTVLAYLAAQPDRGPR